MRKFAFTVAAAMVPAMLLAMLFVGYDYYERERARLIRDSLATTRALAATVDAEFAAVRAAMLALSTSTHLAHGDFAAFHAQGVELVGAQARFFSVVLSDETGRQFVNTFQRYGAPLPASGSADPAGLKRVFATGAPIVSDLVIGRVTKNPIIAVGVPVKRDGAVRYCLNAGLSPARFSTLLDNQHLPEGWIGAVLDTSGTIIARTHDAARFVGSKAAPELVLRIGEAREDAVRSRTLEGIPVLTVFSRAPVSGYAVAIGIPARELLLELYLSMARLFLAGFISLAVALGVALVLGRRFLRAGEA